MQFAINKKYFLIFSLSFILCQDKVDTLKIKNDNSINDDSWKLNLYIIGGGLVPLGQLENNKPLKAFALTGMKAYWLNQMKKSKDGVKDDISDRNRSFWWLFFLHLYGIIDAYVDSHINEFPENIEENINKVENE